ncbi:GNAT family N-acetyltransferase [Ralstonia nicotianae]|uniref:GNAT family N-acetyltransferase n=1 Tax=Ralstonia pseudosolanacearum TaxID=1310165 RepID=UPI002005962B|nr:GNAT family protein [Ralstonia pseudosolanacearum]MCK4120513.1 GNAT family N-acetyltransferase [Ralstonia pseudosolanacearum]
MRIDTPPFLIFLGFEFRQLARADSQAWYDYLSIPSVYEHTSWNLSSPADLDPQFDIFESTAIDSPRRLAIVESKTGRLAGTIGFHTISDTNRSAELAYDLRPDTWGKGLGTAATLAVVEWAQREYGFIRIQATVLTTNIRSARVLQKCGFQHEGLLRAYRMVRGVPGNFNMYSVIAKSISTT